MNRNDLMTAANFLTGSDFVDADDMDRIAAELVKLADTMAAPPSQVSGDAFGRLTREATAAALGCSPGTLANWAVAGIGPKSFKVQPGRRVYYMADEVKKFAICGSLTTEPC